MPLAELRTYVALAEDSPDRASVDLELFAVMNDGTEHLLLADRGFSWSSSPAGSSNWEGMTEAEIAGDARTCVGPDEPREGETREQAELAHWDWIAEDMRIVRGVEVTPTELRDARHVVVLDRALLSLVSQ